ISANASAAMIFSFFVAVIVTPWLMLKLAGRTAPAHHAAAGGGALGRLYAAVARPVLKTRRRSGLFLALVGVATLASFGLLASRDVTVKL
ncbi:hypothetical protein J8J40_28620, partial [Mycobacterium tuberculosis]|nr:hypothetical protein [Mycobacterium tuberculosis]